MTTRIVTPTMSQARNAVERHLPESGLASSTPEDLAETIAAAAMVAAVEWVAKQPHPSCNCNYLPR